MTSESDNSLRCEGCGARLTAGMRFCISCYQPVAGSGGTTAHRETAHENPTIHRTDPAIVFLPEQREAINRRRIRNKRLSVLAGVAFLLICAAPLLLVQLERTRKAAAKPGKSREVMAQAELSLFGEALENFKADVGRYPTPAEGLGALSRKPMKNADEVARIENWSGPYIQGDIELDPWGNDYIYNPGPNGEVFEMFTYGPGGESEGKATLKITSPTPPGAP